MGPRVRNRRGQPQLIPIFRARIERISPPVDPGRFLLVALFTLTVFSLFLFLATFAIFLSIHRTFNESFIPLLYPFQVSVHCEVVWGRSSTTAAPEDGLDFQPLLARLDVFKVAEGNSVSQIAERRARTDEADGQRARGRLTRHLSWIFQEEMFLMLFAEGSVHSRVSSNS